MEILSKIKGRHMTNFTMSLIKNKECNISSFDFDYVIQTLSCLHVHDVMSTVRSLASMLDAMPFRPSPCPPA